MGKNQDKVQAKAMTELKYLKEAEVCTYADSKLIIYIYYKALVSKLAYLFVISPR